MASAWAQSWGSSWGDSWGALLREKEPAGGVFRIRRSVTAPAVRSVHRFGWTVKFPALGLLGLSALPVFTPVTPPTEAAPAHVEVQVAPLVTRVSTEALYGTLRSFFADTVPTCAGNAPFVSLTRIAATPPKVTTANKQNSLNATVVSRVVSELITGAVSLRAIVKKPKVVKNPTEKELIALLRSARRRVANF